MRRDESLESREAEVADILSAYVDMLNEHGLEAPQEVAFLRRYVADPEVLRLLRSARALKAFFDSFGDFPGPGTSESPAGE